MVMNTDKKPRNGVYEWIFQRLANLLIVVYGAIAASHFLSAAAADHHATVAFFSQGWFKLFSLLVLVIICLNSVLAGWQIAGDYINKNPSINKLCMFACIAITIIYLICGFSLLI